jgi:hypothetical protein
LPTCLDLSGMGPSGADAWMTPNCDIATFTSGVTARIAAGELHDAPIHDDVQTLAPGKWYFLGSHVGFSNGKAPRSRAAWQSSLHEVLRVVDDSGAGAVHGERPPYAKL